MRVRLIVNPAASGVSASAVTAVRTPLERVAEVELVVTERAGHGVELAAAEDVEAVIAVGGDGIANEVANGIRPGVAMGVVPAGATSVFARQLGFTTNPARAARQMAAALAAWSTRDVGLGEFNGRRFTFAASVGFDAATTARVAAVRRADPSGRRPRDLRVLMLAVRTLREDGLALHERMTVTCDGAAPMRCSWLALANQHPYTYFGDIPVRAAPRASFATGLDAVVAHELRAGDLWRLIVYGLLWARHATGASRQIGYLHDLAELTVECDQPLAHQLDGEYLGPVSHARIRHLPGALTVLVPPGRIVAGRSV